MSNIPGFKQVIKRKKNSNDNRRKKAQNLNDRIEKGSCGLRALMSGMSCA